MPRITPKRYLVELDEAGTPRTYEVRVIAADILRAEEVGPTYGLTNPQRQSIAINLLWLWAASVRQHETTLSWPEFRAACLDWQKAGEEEAVDPTLPTGPTPSPSSSPSDSEASTSTDGNVPSSTTPAS